MEKTTCTENFLDSKIDWMERTSIEKLLWFKNWSDGKIACIEKLLGFKNWLDGKLLY
jgi:hypothetical protein